MNIFKPFRKQTASNIKTAAVVILIFTLVFSGFFIPNNAVAAGPLTVSIDSAQAVAGEENVVLQLSLSHVTANLPRGISNFKFVIQYNNKVLEVVSVTRGSLIANQSDMFLNPATPAEIRANNGNIVLLHIDDSAGQRPILADGVCAVLTFKVKSGAEPGVYPLIFKAGASSIGQMNAARIYPEDVDLSSAVFNPGTITIKNEVANGKNAVSRDGKDEAGELHFTERPEDSSSFSQINMDKNSPTTATGTDPASVDQSAAGQSSSSSKSSSQAAAGFQSPAAGVDTSVTANSAPAGSPKLLDIDRHWARNYIELLVDAGIIKGYPDGTFKPDHTITRAEFAHVLTLSLGLPDPGYAPEFQDWDTTPDWAKPGIAAAYQSGIVRGFDDSTFKPDQKITRSQIAVMIVKAMNREIGAAAQTTFSDNAQIPTWAKPYINEAMQSQIMNGKGNNLFKPLDYATRAEAACVLVRMR